MMQLNPGPAGWNPYTGLHWWNILLLALVIVTCLLIRWGNRCIMLKRRFLYLNREQDAQLNWLRRTQRNLKGN